MKKVAVVLFNLGGPGGLSEVFGFLFRLFYDRAILDFPNPFRFILALTISLLRLKKAKGIYKLMGGKSPILENTILQAKSLELTLSENYNAKVFVCMSYSNPMTGEALSEVQKFNPDQVVLLPLYPHYSKTTTGPSFAKWKKLCKENFCNSVVEVCCYFQEDGFIKAHQNLIQNTVNKSGVDLKKSVILFSAHSLPQKVIDAGDPYQMQTEITAQKIMQAFEGGNYKVCYQSKVGPTKWLEPSTANALQQAANDGLGVVVVPISFVSEHSETLVELDIDYANLAKELNLPFYVRVPTLSSHPDFISFLKDLVTKALFANCPTVLQNCPCFSAGKRCLAN